MATQGRPTPGTRAPLHKGWWVVLASVSHLKTVPLVSLTALPPPNLPEGGGAKPGNRLWESRVWGTMMRDTPLGSGNSEGLNMLFPVLTAGAGL
jgi:hypothetical protein